MPHFNSQRYFFSPYVQLANYYPEQAVPNEREWAELRAAQMSALTLPNTAIVTGSATRFAKT